MSRWADSRYRVAGRVNFRTGHIPERLSDQRHEERKKVASVNLVILLGNMGQSAELKYTERGRAFCQFTLATNDHWFDQAGIERKSVEWHRIVCWDKLAETCGKWLASGKPLYVEGRKEEQRWTDQTGREHRRCQIVAHRVQFLYQPTREPQSQHGNDPRHYRDLTEEPSFRHRNA